MTPTLIDIDYMARTVWGEARGEEYRGKRAVANVILARASRPRWWGVTVKDACLTVRQFSTWNHDDPNRNKMGEVELDDSVFAECVRACIDAIHTDETSGSDHYYSTAVFQGDRRPRWAVGHEPAFVFGNHQFFNSIS